MDPIAADLVERVLADDELAYLRAPAYRPAVWHWARTEARVSLLSDHLGDEVGDLADKSTATAWALLVKFETTAANARARLGLDPLSRARLGRDITATQVDLVQLLTSAREQQEREAS